MLWFLTRAQDCVNEQVSEEFLSSEDHNRTLFHSGLCLTSALINGVLQSNVNEVWDNVGLIIRSRNAAINANIWLSVTLVMGLNPFLFGQRGTSLTERE